VLRTVSARHPAAVVPTNCAREPVHLRALRRYGSDIGRTAAVLITRASEWERTRLLFCAANERLAGLPPPWYGTCGIPEKGRRTVGPISNTASKNQRPGPVVVRARE
jgi:hypothetical protein